MRGVAGIKGTRKVDQSIWLLQGLPGGWERQKRTHMSDFNPRQAVINVHPEAQTVLSKNRVARAGG